MKLIKTRHDSLPENYLELHYDTIDEQTKAVVERLGTSLSHIEGTYEDRHISVPVSEVFYAETVDRKTFAYTSDMCIEMRDSLRSVLEEFADAGLVRISKSAIVNVYKIERLQGDLNMRVMIFLKNGEKLVMNRGYRNGFFAELEKIKGRNRK